MPKFPFKLIKFRDLTQIQWFFAYHLALENFPANHFKIFIGGCIFSGFLLFPACNSEKKARENLDSTRSDTVKKKPVEVPKKKAVSELTQEEIRAYSKTNPCYLPLLVDTSLYPAGKQAGFKWNELFNAWLDSQHVYRNRYLVGDFNVLNEDSSNRGVEEINPLLSRMIDFEKTSPVLLDAMDRAVHDVPFRDSLTLLIRNTEPAKADQLLNFFNKVWKYKTPPIVRKYGVAGSKVYASGQTLCMCEAYKDTLVQVGRFAISGKRQSPAFRITSDGRKIRSTCESLPVGKGRNYYAAKNYIVSKNWETQRQYEALDFQHDSALGGGNRKVTYYQGKTQLPNFLLIDPDNSYRFAMPSNGIHEVALSELSRGMLGSPNSLGCIRVTDFGSKFLRWWTPQHCNFFILYSNNRYVMKMDNVNAKDLYPFKTREEGNRFRKWLNEALPEKAKALDISESGDHLNGYVIDAYTVYKKEYDAYLKLNKAEPHSDSADVKKERRKR